jgi:SAM-dependent methyltransferase
MAEPKNGYQEDLAYIHDVGFGNFARHAATGILTLLRENGIEHGLVVDLGCGSGLFAAELVRAGYEVLGVDYSAAMLKIARQRVPEARFRRASFLEVALPSCAVITALGEVLSYLFDPVNGRAALEQLFARVYQALPPGGLFIFDVVGPGRAGGPGKRHRNAHGEDWATLVEAEEDLDAMTLTRHITSFRRVGKYYRRSEEVHRLQLYRSTELVAILRDLGFRARRLRGYGEFSLPRGWTAIAARKPQKKA